jgi:hypothetical protein
MRRLSSFSAKSTKNTLREPEHNSLDFKRAGKPVFFGAHRRAPGVNGICQTQGYRGFKSVIPIQSFYGNCPENGP